MPPVRQSGLSGNMELDPINECLVMDRSGMGGPLSKRFEIHFAGSVNVGRVYRRERNQFHRVNFDLPGAHSVQTASSHFRPPP